MAKKRQKIRHKVKKVAVVKKKLSIKREFSAGGIVAKREKDQVFVLVIQHSTHHGWGFPKGHLEEGETKNQAALREVMEETGVRGEIIRRVGDVAYTFTQDGQVIAKRVTFFLMRYLGGDIANHSWEVSSVVWVPVAVVEERLTFESERKLWARISPHVRKYRL